MFIFTEISNVLHSFRKRHSKILCCDHMFDHWESRTGVRKKMSPPECLERIDINNGTSSCLQLTSTEMECVVTELKSLESKGE